MKSRACYTIICKLLIAATFFLFALTDSLPAQNWTELPASNAPSPRANSSAIYYSAENQMIIFGGRTDAGSVNEVWILDLNSNIWENITPTGASPAPRITANAVYDSLMSRMIIWSGQGAELYNDVWAFNLINNTWTQLWQDGNVAGAPLKRYGTAAVFDPLNRRFVNFAGFTTSGRFDDTWSFQVDSIKWTDRTSNVFPEMRCLHSASVSNDNSRMIIYGGQHNGALGDIWSLDLNSFDWIDITPAIRPQGRWFSPIISTGFNSIVLYGGQNPESTLGDLWKFSLATMSWDSIHQSSIKPSNRWGHTAIYISASDKMIIFGGADTGYKNDTWEFADIGTIGINVTTGSIPLNFNLYQNYPNPFNPGTTISYSLSGFSYVRLEVFDISGKKIKELVNQNQQGGEYSVDFKGGNLPSGVYFYTLTAGEFYTSKKMLLLK
jgi:hypothetical protein